MGLLTGTLLTMFIVYAYGACAYRLLQVRKEFEGEEKKEEVEEKEEKEEKEVVPPGQ